MQTMPKSIAARVVKVAQNVKKLHRDQKNEFANYNYTSVDSFYEALGPIMAEAGVFVVIDEARIVVDKGFLSCDYEIYLVSEEGDTYGPMRRQVTVKASGPQAYASAQSYAEKYFLRQLFKIPTGEKDADAHEKTVLPDIKPQVEKLSDDESRQLMEAAILDLDHVGSREDLAEWRTSFGQDFKRSVTKEHLAEVTKKYREVESMLKEKENGEV